MGRRNDALQNPVSALGARCFGQDVVLGPFVGSGGADFSSRSACSAAGELGGGFLKFIFAARLPKSPPDFGNPPQRSRGKQEEGAAAAAASKSLLRQVKMLRRSTSVEGLLYLGRKRN